MPDEVKPEVKPVVEEKPVTRAEFDTLMQSVNSLGSGIEKLVTISAERGQQQPQQEVEEEEEDQEIEGLETMPRKDFLNLIADRVVKRVNKEVARPLSAKLDQVAAGSQNNELRNQVSAVAEKNADFWEWKDEMLEIAKEFGPAAAIHPRRLLQLARSENPDKYEALKAKMKKDAPAAKEEKETAPKKQVRNFSGLTPGNTPGEVKHSKMGFKDASSSAWDETVAAAGGDPFAA